MSEVEGATFEAEEFSWIARVSAEPNVLVATGPGANEYVNATVLPQIYFQAGDLRPLLVISDQPSPTLPDGNEELGAEAEEQQRDIDPLSGPEMLDAVRRALDAPAEFQELVKETA